ncbi:MAG: glutamyl-tRNA reductase [Ignavibacteria bacterium]|nr:MAG: glutamyl-tRNA reductase [Ignavibacteria bacterium]KAF0160998.1 MAG: glutamyl-tRNA reductase [Ignavibacteria bacterium]
MNLIGISINHKTSPLELREAVHLTRDEIVEFIPSLKKYLSDGVVISTCNRTEIFGFLQLHGFDAVPLIDSLISFKPNLGIKTEHFSKYFSCGAVKHIFSVASGIDSLIIGDSQILGQVKESFEISEDLDFSGSVLRRIFETAAKVGKRAIKETTIGEGAVTVSYAAVQVVEKIFSSLDKKSALVIGAGETGELAAVHLRDKGVGKITIANRTIERAAKLSEKVNGEIISFQFLNEQLHNFDIVISATSSSNFIVSLKDVQTAMKKRRGSPIVIMDIAVPRDIDPEVKKIDNVFYHDMDSLKIIVDQNLQKRKDQLPYVENIIMEEMISFFGWYNSLDVVPTIKTMRSFFEEIRQDELEKIKHKLNEEDFSKVEDMTRRMIGRLLHNPTIKLREYAETGSNIKEVTNNTVILKELFNLIDNKSSVEEKKI